MTEKPRQLIRHLCQFDLQASLTRLRSLSKNIKNQRRSVDDLCSAKNFLQIARLYARQLIVKNDDIRFSRLHSKRKLVRFAASNIGRRIRSRFFLEHRSDDNCTSCFRKPRKLAERFFAVQADQKCTFRFFLRAVWRTDQNLMVCLLDGIHPRSLRDFTNRRNICQMDSIDASDIFAQKRRLYTGRMTILRANRRHRIKVHGTQRAEVYIRKLRISARMRMNTAYHAQPARIAAQMNILQLNTPCSANRDIQHLAASGNVHADFTVDCTCKCSQHIQQLGRRKNLRRNFEVIQRFQLRKQGIAYALLIAIDHESSPLIQNAAQRIHGF